MKKKILKTVMCAVAIMMATSVSAQVSFYIEDFAFVEGETEKEVAIFMTNEPSNITGIQMDIYLSEGLTILSDDIGYIFDFAGRTTSRKHVIESAMQKDGAVRIVSASPKLYPFTGNEGEILYFTVVADESFDGSGVIELKNCVATGANTDGSDIVEYLPADSQATVTMSSTSGVEESLIDVDGSAEYFNLQGMKVAKENLIPGVYVKKTATQSTKVIIK